jgi:hypothetical protein
MTGSEMTLARYYARQAVKAEWRRLGVKPHHIVASELNRQADVYLDQHPELIALATARYQDFVKRSLAQRQKNLRKVTLCRIVP